jgi:hypothetical protein
MKKHASNEIQYGVEREWVLNNKCRDNRKPHEEFFELIHGDRLFPKENQHVDHDQYISDHRDSPSGIKILQR